MSFDASAGSRRMQVAGLLPGHPAFDAFFILASLLLALGLGAVASLSASALIAVVWMDVWLLANPHVVATFSRIGACIADVRRHWFLLFFLPLFVLAGLSALVLAWEVAGLFTLYFVAQTWHVARQSFGIARAYKRADPLGFQADRLAEALVYLFPAWGLLARCAQAPDAFLGYPIQLPAVSPIVVDALGLMTMVCGAWWLHRQVHVALKSGLDWRHDGFIASHVCVSMAAYLWISDITVGWVVVNAWHNIQYLMFVWVRNLRRDGYVRVEVTGLGRHAARYAAVCLVLGAALYQVLDHAGTRLLWLGLPTVLIAHFTFNFHHYLVDGVIWRRPRLSRVQRHKTNSVHEPANNMGTMN